MDDVASPDRGIEPTEAANRSNLASTTEPTHDDLSRLPIAGRPRRKPLVTTRIGTAFFVASTVALVCAIAASSTSHIPQFQSLMWIATISACALGGLISMRSVKTLRTIETELHHCHGSPDRWKNARPILGQGEITAAWNELLHEAAISQERTPDRESASLDQEAITLARAMRGLPTAWVITDLNGRILFISPPACNMFSLAENANHIGRDLLDLLGLRAGDDAVIAKRQRLLSNVRMIQERHRSTMGDETVHLRIARSRLGGRSGDGEGMAWTLADVTQQELATKSRDQFLLTATHELRTPLNNLQAYAEALQEEASLDADRQNEFCNVIVSEANRLGQLVDQLLTVGQMEANSMVPHRQELAVLPLVEFAMDQLAAQAKQKRQELVSDFPARLPGVFGDQDKLQAAMVNLIGNAVKYTPADGEIVVRLHADEHWIRMDVIDNGPGIAPEEQTQVFEKFYRGSSVINTDLRGSGLGLAFTREVARMHGGDIDLETTLGEGCIFTMRLPTGGQSRSGI